MAAAAVPIAPSLTSAPVLSPRLGTAAVPRHSRRLCLTLPARLGLLHGASRGGGGVAVRFVERVGPTLALREGGVEPDLPEDSSESFATAGEDQEFPWGIADGHHTWHGGNNGSFWGEVQKEIKDAGGPTGGQAVISWLFLPVLFIGLAFHVKEEYLFLYTALFIFAFIGMELAKPVKESNFLPEIYRSEDET